MGETGIEGQLRSRLSISVCVHSHPWTSNLLSQRGEQDEAVDAVSVRVSTVSVCVISVYDYTHGHMYVYIRGVYVCSVCVCLVGTHQPCYWLDLGTWSCSNLTSLRLLDMA